MRSRSGKLVAPERRVSSSVMTKMAVCRFGEGLFVARNGGDLDVHQFFDIHLRKLVGRSLRVTGGEKRKDEVERN